MTSILIMCDSLPTCLVGTGLIRLATKKWEVALIFPMCWGSHSGFSPASFLGSSPTTACILLLAMLHKAGKPGEEILLSCILSLLLCLLQLQIPSFSWQSTQENPGDETRFSPPHSQSWVSIVLSLAGACSTIGIILCGKNLICSYLAWVYVAPLALDWHTFGTSTSVVHTVLCSHILNVVSTAVITQTCNRPFPLVSLEVTNAVGIWYPSNPSDHMLYLRNDKIRPFHQFVLNF